MDRESRRVRRKCDNGGGDSRDTMGKAGAKSSRLGAAPASLHLGFHPHYTGSIQGFDRQMCLDNLNLRRIEAEDDS